MAGWRPERAVRVKVIGLVWKEGQLLAFEIENDNGGIDGVRPLGGTIELGETREGALHREFFEELGTSIRITGPWHVFENIFEHEGHIGHEYIFAATVELLDKSYYSRDEIIFCETDGTTCLAKWYDPAALRAVNLELYPAGLEKLIQIGIVG